MKPTLQNLAKVLGIDPWTLALQARAGLHPCIGVAKPKGRAHHMYVIYPEKLREEFGQAIYDKFSFFTNN